MLHPIHQRMAHLLVNYCTEVRPGENVLINANTLALPLVRALVHASLAAGGRPHLRTSYPELVEDVLAHAPDAYFELEPDLELAEIERVQAWIRVAAPHNSRALAKVDKRRLGRLAQQHKGVLRKRLRGTRWVGTLFPTNVAAQDAGMSLSEFERFVFKAMHLFDDDPTSQWRGVHAFQARLIDRLSRASEVRITGNGTDLTLSVRKRTWINSDGKRNMPSGEVFTAPIEDSARGVVTFDVPSAWSGSVVENVTLRFDEGRVTDASATQGEDLLLSQLEVDSGARYLGEIGIGTNEQITAPIGNTLFDEKMAGTVHLALGRAYEESGGVNDSAIHWDLICDLRKGGAIFVDGEAFVEDGRFVGLRAD